MKVRVWFKPARNMMMHHDYNGIEINIKSSGMRNCQSSIL